MRRKYLITNPEKNATELKRQFNSFAQIVKVTTESFSFKFHDYSLLSWHFGEIQSFFMARTFSAYLFKNNTQNTLL